MFVTAQQDECKNSSVLPQQKTIHDPNLLTFKKQCAIVEVYLAFKRDWEMDSIGFIHVTHTQDHAP